MLEKNPKIFKVIDNIMHLTFLGLEGLLRELPRYPQGEF